MIEGVEGDLAFDKEEIPAIPVVAGLDEDDHEFAQEGLILFKAV